MRRNTRTPILKGNKLIGTGRAGIAIYRAVKNGNIKVEYRILKGGERLDILAGRIYGNSSLWWVIAAASGIGWNLQVPPGIQLVIPLDLNEVSMVVE